MPKKSTSTDDHHNTETSLSPSKLVRKPIHREDETEDKDRCDEDVNPNPSKVYRSLVKELLEESKESKRQTTQKAHPPQHVVDSEEEARKSNGYCNLKYISFILCSIVVLFFAIFNQQPEKPAAKGSVDLTEFIAKLKDKFKGQDDQTFQILKSSLKRVLNESSKPATPSIFTIIANKGAENTASDFSIFIAQELAFDHYVSINQSVPHWNPDNLKYNIDTEIKSKFDNRSLNVAVIDRFDNIPIGAAMIFHNYCDHENAPFKRAIFLFIVHLNQKIIDSSKLKIIDEVAMQALRDIWRDASDDIVDSLITRLTVNVINIK